MTPQIQSDADTSTNIPASVDAALLVESVETIKELLRFINNPNNFGDNLPMQVEDARREVASSAAKQLMRNRAYSSTYL